jgi:hypothetical protein
MLATQQSLTKHSAASCPSGFSLHLGHSLALDPSSIWIVQPTHTSLQSSYCLYSSNCCLSHPLIATLHCGYAMDHTLMLTFSHHHIPLHSTDRMHGLSLSTACINPIVILSSMCYMHSSVHQLQSQSSSLGQTLLIPVVGIDLSLSPHYHQAEGV